MTKQLQLPCPGEERGHPQEAGVEVASKRELTCSQVLGAGDRGQALRRESQRSTQSEPGWPWESLPFRALGHCSCTRALPRAQVWSGVAPWFGGRGGWMALRAADEPAQTLRLQGLSQGLGETDSNRSLGDRRC